MEVWPDCLYHMVAFTGSGIRVTLTIHSNAHCHRGYSDDSVI